MRETRPGDETAREAEQSALLAAARAGRTGLLLRLLHASDGPAGSSCRHATAASSSSSTGTAIPEDTPATSTAPAAAFGSTGGHISLGPLLRAAAECGQTMTVLALLRFSSPTDEANQWQLRTAARAARDAGHEQTALAMIRAAGDADALRLLDAAAA